MQIIQLLIEKSQNFNQINRTGQTPLKKAQYKKLKDIVKLIKLRQKELSKIKSPKKKRARRKAPANN